MFIVIATILLTIGAGALMLYKFFLENPDSTKKEVETYFAIRRENPEAADDYFDKTFPGGNEQEEWEDPLAGIQGGY